MTARDAVPVVLADARSTTEKVGRFVGSVGGYFLIAWWTMLLLPVVFNWQGWGFWRTLGAVFVIKTVFPATGDTYLWRASRD